MISPDFSDRTYTAEVIKAKNSSLDVFKAISRLARHPTLEDHVDDRDASMVKVCHAFLPTPHNYHRYPRTITSPDGNEITIPRQDRVQGHDCNLYDVVIALHDHHVVVAVPFHDLAEEFFVDVHKYLAGMGTRYEKLNITSLVIKLGSAGATKLPSPDSSDSLALSVTRCHLTYADQKCHTSHLQQIRMNGANLGLRDEYKALVAPVIDASRSDLTVTPTVLGFALLANGVRKSSATTDMHGNFKLWVAPGLRRLVRLFRLLEALEAMKEVTATTTNLPILQSRPIRDAED